MGRRIDFGFFEKYNFSIDSRLENMGWKNFCSMNIPMYPKLVREYYENMRRGVDGLVTTVKGISFEIFESILARVFDIPREEIMPEKVSD